MSKEIREIFGAGPAASCVREASAPPLEAYLPANQHKQPTVREIELGPAIRLQIIESPRGPVLRIRAPRIALEADEALDLRAGKVRIESTEELTIEARRIQTEATERLTTIAGSDRLEAGVIQAQASRGALSLKAQGGISLDGEHIGLNDDPCPRPFAWSRRAKELGHGE